MPLSFSDLRNRIIARAGVRSFSLLSPDSVADTGKTNLNTWINERKDLVIGENALRWKFIEGKSFTTVANKREYILSDLGFGDILRVISVYEKTNDRELTPIYSQDFRRSVPDETTAATSSPFYYEMIGNSKILIYPTPSSAIAIFIDYERAFPDLKDDNDTFADIGVPEAIVPVFERTIANAALIDIYEYLNQPDKQDRALRGYALSLSSLLRVSTTQRPRLLMKRTGFPRRIPDPVLPPAFGDRGGVAF